ncbi:MAG: alpha/beta hydrolase [Cyclobacteriaceae bacterium]|nr:alpha/beta hydrolase [Cyclobacteriaceae bacterium]
MKPVYLLSGLGADKRVFDFLKLDDVELIHIEWVRPEVSESIEAYSERIRKQIVTNKPILIGVSFGGIIATEIAKQVDFGKVVLISSVATKYEIPLLYRVAGQLRIHRLIPSDLFMYINSITYWLFGITNDGEKRLLKEIIRTTDRIYLKWAIDKIVRWRNTHKPVNTIKIHGGVDKILPAKQADYIINGGGHFMIVNKASEISEILNDILS